MFPCCKHGRKLIIFWGQLFRFGGFLHSNLLKLCSRSKHTNAKKLLEEVNGYGTASMPDRSKLLNKVYSRVNIMLCDFIIYDICSSFVSLCLNKCIS